MKHYFKQFFPNIASFVAYVNSTVWYQLNYLLAVASSMGLVLGNRLCLAECGVWGLDRVLSIVGTRKVNQINLV
jgi:hypothetical protein